MKFIKKYTTETECEIHHYSNGRMVGTIQDGDRLWPKYLEQESNGKVEEQAYIAPETPPGPTDSQLAQLELDTRDDQGEDLRVIEDLAEAIDPDRTILPQAAWDRVDTRKAIRTRL